MRMSTRRVLLAAGLMAAALLAAWLVGMSYVLTD
jgi:hypothetical protein